MGNGKIEYDIEAVQEFIDARFPPYTYDNKGQMTMICPFCHGGQHEEVSFKIDIDKGVANCYRKNKCNFKGSVVFMIKEFLSCDWHTAYEIATGKPPENIDEIIGLLSQSSSYGDMPPMFDYAPQTHIRVMPNQVIPVDESPIVDDVCDWLYSYRGYDPDDFLASHDLYFTPEDRFRGRILFKVSTNDDYAYQAYTYDKSLAFDYDSKFLKSVKSEVDVRKTLNPPGEVLSRLLYNYNEAKRAGIVFIVEGIFDAARIIEHGFYPVAIFGCNLSVTQALLIGDLRAQEIVVCLDNGAEEAAMDVLENLNKYCSGKKLSLMNLDIEGADPDMIELDDFMRCFIKRRHILNSNDAIDMLAALEVE